MNSPLWQRAALAALLAGTALGHQASAQVTGEDAPWTLSGALDTPEWFELKGYFHTRYELARYLVTMIDPIRHNIDNLETDSNLWSWIAIHWMNDSTRQLGVSRRVNSQLRRLRRLVASASPNASLVW